MAKYLTNKKTQAAIEDIIDNAQKSLVLVSPYIKITNQWLSRLKSCANNGVIITIIYRKDKVGHEELSRLSTIKNINLKSTGELHAKCYFNEKEMVITSFNLLETSEKNWEMGIHINKIDDKEIYEDARKDVNNIFSTSDSFEIPLAENKKPNPKQTSFSEVKLPIKGHCIRCEKTISFDMKKPYCKECYNSWAKYGNYEYEEVYCHACSDFVETTIEKPLCYKCYKKYKEVI